MNETLTRVLDSLRGRFAALSGAQRLTAAIVLLLVIAGGAAMLLQDKGPAYQPLFGQVDPSEGGAIIASLQKRNVPYQVETGGAITVPADKVAELRLQLAAEGLPRSGAQGFELLDKTRLGASQFSEQVTYQRAIEGELSRSVETLGAVKSARVHLALPEESVFLQDQVPASASVMVTLFPGRTLDEGQVSAIVHLISSSVPRLQAKGVTVVDQSGQLLTRDPGQEGLSPGQTAAVRKIEREYSSRLQALLSPLVGKEGVRVSVTAELDTSSVEESSERYQPNTQYLRSEQWNKSKTPQGSSGGVPGALSNQPPSDPAAPFNLPAPPMAPLMSPQVAEQDSGTKNYELDKTVRHVTQPAGQRIKRLTVAILLDNKPDKTGARTVALKPAELQSLEGLAQEAVGFDAARGDTLKLVNLAFSPAPKPAAEPVLPWYQQPWVLQLAQTGGWILLGILLIVFVLRPLLRPAKVIAAAEPAPTEGAPLSVTLAGDPLQELPAVALTYEERIARARDMALGEPKRAAQVIKGWLKDE